MVGPAIVEQARAAVRRLVDAAPRAAEALGQIERAGLGPPYTVVIAGDLAARTELLNVLAGERLFDPARQEPGRIVLTLRRGPATSMRARRRDGSIEDRVLEPEPAPPADDEPPAEAGDAEPAEAAGSDRPGAVAPTASPLAARPAARPEGRAQTVRVSDVPAFHDAVVEAIVRSAEGETTAVVRRPPWWAVWTWVAAWWRTRRARRAQAAASARPRAPALPPGADAPSPGAPATPATPATPAATVRRAFANTIPRSKRPGDARQELVAAIRACLADDTVERLFVEVPEGPLPDKVIVLELPGRASARSLEAVGADACLVACGADVFAITEQIETALSIVPHVFAVGAAERAARLDPRVRPVSVTAAVSNLARIAMIERAIAVGGRAIAALSAGSAALDAEIIDAEIEFRARIDRLEALRIASLDDHIADALARIRPSVTDHVQHLLRSALGELDGAIAELGAAWSAQLGAAGSADALRTVAAQIDAESPGVLQAAQASAHRALVDGLTRCARVHHDELVGELRRGTPRDEPPPPWLAAEVTITELTSSTSLGAVAPRLSSLFRSLDTLRAEALAQLDQRIAKLRQVASANVRDTEPQLEATVTGTLAIALRGELERRAAWIEAELARTRIAIDQERLQLAGLAIARDAARADERELATALDALASDLP